MLNYVNPIFVNATDVDTKKTSETDEANKRKRTEFFEENLYSNVSLVNPDVVKLTITGTRLYYACVR